MTTGTSPRRSLMWTLMWCVTVALVLPVAIADAARFVDLSRREFGGITYVSLDELAGAVNATKRFESALETGAIRLADREYSFLVGSRIVRSGDRAWNLLGPVVADAGQLWVTADLLNQVLTDRSELDASLDTSADRARLLLTAGPSVQPDLPPTPVPLTQSAKGPQRVNRIVIDPSHGGGDLGAALPGGVREKWATLDLARKVADELRGAGFEVVLTRNEDRDIDPEARAAFANQMGGDLFLSLGAGVWGEVDQKNPEDHLWIIVHGSVGPIVEPTNVAGFRLRRWNFAQERHLQASMALARSLAAATGSDVARLPLRVTRGVNMPAATIIFSPASALKNRWTSWQTQFSRDVLRAVREFERGATP